MIDAWNAVGLDYAVFGNHEFDIKTPDLLARMKESKFTWLGANVVDTRTGRIFADTPPYVIREIGGIKIGIIGLLLPETKQTSSMEESLAVTDYCAVAKKLVKEMRRKKKADAVIGLTHLSMADDKKLAGCADFDLILGGHEHSLLQSSSFGTPIFKMTADAREMGKFNLNFNAATRRLAEPRLRRDRPGHGQDRRCFRSLHQYSRNTAACWSSLRWPSGRRQNASTPFQSRAGQKRRTLAILSPTLIEARLTRMSALLMRIDPCGPDVRTRPADRDVLSLLPFNNPIVKVRATGKVLKAILEHGVARSVG